MKIQNILENFMHDDMDDDYDRPALNKGFTKGESNVLETNVKVDNVQVNFEVYQDTFSKLEGDGWNEPFYSSNYVGDVTKIKISTMNYIPLNFDFDVDYELSYPISEDEKLDFVEYLKNDMVTDWEEKDQRVFEKYLKPLFNNNQFLQTMFNNIDTELDDVEIGEI